ncbi:hypothetical protein Moror_9852 [Moniliophthora roreri MCA 2997]|uniref:Uncharacterized protein n=1 Tax=Moniliophthora roreri (strain MCA 2997) TaxID=1381753 RepID=V2X136_MONRO|nr:hypothetical protein Moror_9852 [Moniliophthora roreri MCA 2997]
MTTIAPPRINDATLPATPAHEWAQETSSKLQATSDTTLPSSEQPTLASSVSTPGVDVPGSYPRGHDANAPDVNPAGVLDMAKQYLPGQQDVQQALRNATETAKQYLPQSVAAYLPGGTTHPTTLPSQDGPQKPFEHSDGVGSLPGNQSEASVAKLPDEREAETQSPSGITTHPTTLPSQDGPQEPFEHSNGVGSLPGNQSEASVAKLPDERKAKTENTSASSGGVGDLPGSHSEAGVAKLPEERALEEKNQLHTSNLTPSTSLPLESVSNASIVAQLGDTPAQTPGVRQSPLSKQVTNGTSVGGVGDLPGGKSESSVAVLPDEKNSMENIDSNLKPHSGEPANLNPRTHPLAAEGAKWKGVPLDELFQAKLDANPHAQLHIGDQKPLPITPHTDSTVAVTGHERSSNAAPPTNGKFTEDMVNGDRKDHQDLASMVSGGSSGSDGSRSVGGIPRKAKLMDKIKGEVKVISGKLGGKEEKVEEGRRLMGKS